MRRRKESRPRRRNRRRKRMMMMSGWIQMEWKMRLRSRIGLVLRSTKRKIGEVDLGNVDFARRRIL